ncbi:MAG: MoaD/ThiS family protein [Pseudomonadales bacterium]|nr:MoaD/ThiS family protein [Pseudomonadales bacterium]
MKFTVHYFASYRERLSLSTEQLAWAGAEANLGEVRAFLQARGGAWAEVMSSSGMLMSLNQSLASVTAVVSDGDEVAFFPPVTGG